MRKFKPLKDNVIVELIHDEEQSGIILLDKDERRQILKKKDKRVIGGRGYDLHMRDGIVRFVGPDTKYLHVGDQTRVNVSNGHRFKDKDTQYLSLREIDTELVVIS